MLGYTYSFQFIWIAQSVCWNHGEPLLTPLFGVHGKHVCSDESRRDTVYPAEIHPFDRQTPSELDQSGFRSIIGGLLLRYIDQNGTNRRSEDQVAKALLLENLCRSLSCPECAIEVDTHDLTPLIAGVILSWEMRCDTGIRYDDVDFAEIIGNLLNGACQHFSGFNLGLICYALDVVGNADVLSDLR